MSKILVTGGAGYIGSHTVVELFNEGYIPVIIDNFSNAEKAVIKRIEKIIHQPVKFYEGDCNDRSFIEKVFNKEENINGVIHFAAYKAVGESVKKPLKYYKNNVGSLIVLMEAMEKNKVTNLVFSSSCTVYGQPDVLPVTEETPKKPAESPYGNTKKICEELLEDYSQSNSLFKSVALRYFNPIGAHPTGLIGELPIGVPNNLVPFITQTAAGLREKLTVFGNTYNTPDGTCIRDFIHVVDLAKAHVQAIKFLESKASEKNYDVFNIGTGKGNTVLEVIQTFEKVNSLKLNYIIGSKREGDVEKVYANVDKANKILNWRASLSLEQSLKDAWNWENKINNKNEHIIQ
jgi:UDP-glucose 4-epimerase